MGWMMIGVVVRGESYKTIKLSCECTCSYSFRVQLPTRVDKDPWVRIPIAIRLLGPK